MAEATHYQQTGVMGARGSLEFAGDGAPFRFELSKSGSSTGPLHDSEQVLAGMCLWQAFLVAHSQNMDRRGWEQGDCIGQSPCGDATSVPGNCKAADMLQGHVVSQDKDRATGPKHQCFGQLSGSGIILTQKHQRKVPYLAANVATAGNSPGKTPVRATLKTTLLDVAID